MRIPARVRSFAKLLEDRNGEMPFLVLSCEGGSDEHWQFWYEDDMEFPAWIAYKKPAPTGNHFTMERHPDYLGDAK